MNKPNSEDKPGAPTAFTGSPFSVVELHLCAHCGKQATCKGAYEGSELEEYACDDCCGHGNEDGYCSSVVEEEREPAELPNSDLKRGGDEPTT